MPQKKLFAALLVAASALLMLGMSNENQIPYPSNYDTKSAGASSYNGLANVPKSPYFQQLDFYNMQPTDSLVLLPKFRTYQQTSLERREANATKEIVCRTACCSISVADAGHE